MYPVIFRFGAFQVTLDESNIAYVRFGNVFRVIFAVMFGAVGAGQAGVFAPNYTKARLSANRIFSLLDRKPVIDGYSEEGTKLVTYFIQESGYSWRGVSLDVSSGYSLDVCNMPTGVIHTWYSLTQHAISVVLNVHGLCFS